MFIRRETPQDLDAIDRIHRLAFAANQEGSADPVEVSLVHALRSSPDWMPALSLVAEDRGTVVGHVVATRGHLPGATAVGLGPLGVLPDRQGDGVGAALMHAVLGAADALDIAVVVLLGHIDYYPRFGFVPASTLGIEAPDSGWGRYFQARPLTAWRPEFSGGFRYAEPFENLDSA